MLFQRQAVFGYFLLLQKVTNIPPFRKAKHIPPQKNTLPPLHTPSPPSKSNQIPPALHQRLKLQPKHAIASQNMSPLKSKAGTHRISKRKKK